MGIMLYNSYVILCCLVTNLHKVEYMSHIYPEPLFETPTMFARSSLSINVHGDVHFVQTN